MKKSRINSKLVNS